MSRELTHRSKPLVPHPYPPRAHPAVEAARLPGQVAAAKIEAAAFATYVGLSNTAMLSALEGRLLQQVPLAEPRLKAIVDSYATYVCQELALLAYR